METRTSRDLNDPAAGNTVPTSVGRMLILGKLGEGGMGVVYAAYDPDLDRKVAVKMLRPDRFGGAESRARLLREAQALARLAHPNVVAVHDVGTDGRRVWIAMEFVQGRTVAAWLAERPRGWREVVEVFVQAAGGIEAAHRASLLHRDLKPANIMIGDDGRVRVMDFGLVRSASAEDPARDPATDERAPLSEGLTRTGSLLGTPAYMAPEQFLGHAADERSDQFSLCVALWEALYGQRPFPAESFTSRARAQLAGQPVRPERGPHVPRWLWRVVRRGLAPRREARFANVAELRRALEADPTGRRWAAGAALAAVLGLGTWFGARHVQHERALAACDAAGAEIDAVWNSEARERLRTGLLGSGAGFAASVTERTLPWLERNAEEWRQTTSEVCRAIYVQHSLDPALVKPAESCLADVRGELEQLLTLLSHPRGGEVGRGVVENAVAAAAALPSPLDCSDEKHLRGLSRAPEDDTMRTEVRRVQGLLSEAAALLNLGAYEEGLERADAARAGAVAITWAPVVLAADAIRGSLLMARGRYKEAEQALEAAHFGACSTADDTLCAATAIRLTRLLGEYLERPEEGLRWSRTAKASLDRVGIGSRDVRRADLRTNVAVVHLKAGRYSDAIPELEEVLRIRQEALGAEHPDVAGSLHNLCTAYRHTGEEERALELCERAAYLYEVAFGPEHPRIALPLQEIAILHASRGSFAPAREMFERVLAIEERARGPEHPSIGGTLGNLSQLSALQGDLVQATSFLQRANSIFTAALGPEDPTTIKSLGSLGSLYRQQGAFDRAEEILLRALGLKEKRLGLDHLEVAYTLEALGNLYCEQGDGDAAIRVAERALKIEEKHVGSESIRIVRTIHTVGVAHAVKGDHRRAINWFRRALAIWQKQPDLEPLAMATGLESLGQSYVRSGERERGITELQRALEIQNRLRSADDPSAASTLTALGWALTDAGRAEEARPHLERALRLQERFPGDPGRLAETRFELARALWGSVAERPRALSLARQARDEHAAQGVRRAASVKEIDRWLSAHDR